MSEEIRKVQHDGTRNYLGGRNMILGSASPMTATYTSDAVALVGMARADITSLDGYPLTDMGTADNAVLCE